VTNGEVVTVAIVLSAIGCVGRTIGCRVIRASENAIDAVLVQDIGVKEHADTSSRLRYGMTKVVGALLLTGSCADTGVVWLS
jgi:hypothetical protein